MKRKTTSPLDSTKPHHVDTFVQSEQPFLFLPPNEIYAIKAPMET